MNFKILVADDEYYARKALVMMLEKSGLPISVNGDFEDGEEVIEYLQENEADIIITDIRMRMLQPRELFAAQGFPHDYVIDHDADGHPYPKSKQVARCGNAVTPQVPAALVRANLPEYCGKGEDL